MEIGAVDARSSPLPMVVFENEVMKASVKDLQMIATDVGAKYAANMNSGGGNAVVATIPAATGCNGCSPTFYEGRDAASISSADDETPTTSSTDSTEKSDGSSSGNNTFAAKKGKAEGYCNH